MSDTTKPLQRFSADLQAVVADAAPSGVAVHSARSRSSGFAWRPGLIITADEALAEGEIIVTLPGGQTTAATLAGRDPTTDIALLRIDADLPAAALTAAAAGVGELVIVAGAEDGSPTAALGIVALAAGPWRSLRGGEIDARIELDIALRRSAEGSLVRNAAGAALGMAVFGPRRRVIVIPAATIERVATRLQSHGRIARGYLGLALQPVKTGNGGSGAMVMGVDGGGPGATAGLRQGDVITAWDTTPVRSLQTLLRSLGPDSVGTTVTLTLSRGGDPIEVPLTIGERPQA